MIRPVGYVFVTSFNLQLSLKMFEFSELPSENEMS